MQYRLIRSITTKRCSSITGLILMVNRQTSYLRYLAKQKREDEDEAGLRPASSHLSYLVVDDCFDFKTTIRIDGNSVIQQLEYMTQVRSDFLVIALHGLKITITIDT